MAYLPLPDSVFIGMSRFIGARHLRRAALTYIASKLSEKEIETLRDIFRTLDVDGDGTLTKHELY